MKIATVVPVDHKAGEVGIEIELEGPGLGVVRSTPTWKCEADGSLRGDSVELVLREPCMREDVRKNLLRMKRMIRDAKPRDTHRAGIHVHINVQQLEERELVQFMVLYYIFEECLLDWCGKDRSGNLFCLGASDAEYVIERAYTAIRRGDWAFLATDNIRYASMNLKALWTYGSLEFRAMRSTTAIGDIVMWVDMLLAIKDEAVKYPTPRDIVERLSFENTEMFFKRILGDFPIEYNRDAIMRGVRNAQILAYCRQEWDAPFDSDRVDHGLDVWKKRHQAVKELIDLPLEEEEF